MSPRESPYRPHQAIGLVAGPALALAMLVSPPPAGLSAAGWAVAAVAMLMAVWWMTEAVPLAAAALLPLVLFPPLGVAPIERVAAPYADPLIFLFLGGFVLAVAIEKWGLGRRLALLVLAASGQHPARVIGGVMAATAFLSLWISNTATAVTMLPIGQSIVAALRRTDADAGAVDRFAAALMLAIAYAASIGGLGTIIGTPPNALLVGFMRERYGFEIGFAQWMLVGIPAVLVLLPLAWLVLTRWTPGLGPLGGHGLDLTQALAEARAPLARGEAMVAALFCLAAVAWIGRPLIASFVPGLLSDAGIAIAAAVLLLVLPVGRGRFLLAWEDAARLPWHVLLLFGGGLALAAAVASTDLAAWIGQTMGGLGAMPHWALVLAVAAAVTLLSELASNTAVAAVFLPVAGATAIALGDHPLALALPVALAASMGFMLPVATPPNAIVFGSGAVSAPAMLRAGAVLDVIGVLAVATLAMTLGAWLLQP